jgi:nitroreductase
MNPILDAIFRRRATKVFQPVEISAALREQILDAARVAPSSFNSQPYRFYWVHTPAMKRRAAELCFNQRPAATASVLVVAVADIGSWRATTEAHLRWVRNAGFSDEEVAKHEKRSKFAKYFFVQGWLNVFGGLKWLVLRALHVWKIVGMAPVSRQGLFKWATKSASLACENLMIAAEALELNTCPMEGFDGRRLSKLLGLSTAHHEIVMVIAVGKRSPEHKDPPQWRRTLDATVSLL